jgi:hypothetical protein
VLAKGCTVLSSKRHPAILESSRSLASTALVVVEHFSLKRQVYKTQRQRGCLGLVALCSKPDHEAVPARQKSGASQPISALAMAVAQMLALPSTLLQLIGFTCVVAFAPAACSTGLLKHGQLRQHVAPR